MADLFTRTGEYFMAYDENGNEQVISFKHRANDAVFDDGVDMETKMAELFQYGNDFKQSIADAVIARGGDASADMTKEEMTNAVLALDNVQYSNIVIDVSKLDGNGGWTASTGKLTAGNTVYLPLSELVEDVNKLICVVYIINSYYTVLGYLRMGDVSHSPKYIDIINTSSGLVITDGGYLLSSGSIPDIVKLLNDGSATITITSLKVYVLTK